MAVAILQQLRNESGFIKTEINTIKIRASYASPKKKFAIEENFWRGVNFGGRAKERIASGALFGKHFKKTSEALHTPQRS